MDEAPQFQKVEDFAFSQGNDQLSFRAIILNHLQKIMAFASVEFRGGYYTERRVSPSSNETVRVYVPDSREIYSNAIEVFADTLFPHFDDTMKNEEESIEKDKAKLKQTMGKKMNDNTATKSEMFDYRQSKASLNKKLYRHLSSFLFREKYLELGSMND